MRRRLFRSIAAFVLAFGCAAALAAGPAPCTDRLPVADRPAGVPAHLPELAYDCVRLDATGRAAWIGEAGREHATTVLLVHGLGHMAHRDWRRVIGPLSRQFHVLTVDLPGFGASEALAEGHGFDTLDRVLDEVVARFAHEGRAHVVGHSLGGAVSLNFAHRHPARVDRLVLVDAAGILLMNLYTMPSSRLALPEVGVGGIDRVLRRVDANLNGFGRTVAGRLDDRMDIGRWLRANPAIRNALLGKSTQVEAAIGLVEHDFGEAVREVGAPTVLIWGRDDPVAPLRTGRLLAGQMRHARLEVIDGAGHLPMVQRADAFLPLLLAALADPMSPPSPARIPDGPSQGDVRCDARLHQRYTGRWGTVELVNCQDVVIEDAVIDHLVLRNATVRLDHVTIASDDVAIDAHRSRLTGTNVQVSGRVAARARNSTLDFAGARLAARERALEIATPSWFYFSISEIDAPDHRGPVHRAWPSAPTAAVMADERQPRRPAQ